MRSEWLAVGSILLLGLTVTGVRGARADTLVNIGAAPLIKLDNPKAFRASGTLVATDTSAPTNGILIPIGNELAIIGVNWEFEVNLRLNGFPGAAPPIGPWDTVGPLTGARGATVRLQGGRHKIPPHGEGLNNLPGKTSTKELFIPTVPAGKPAAQFAVPLNVFSRKKHGDHLDTYNLTSDLVAVLNGGGAGQHQLTGPFQVRAKHTNAPKKSSIILGVASVGSSASAGSTVSFDAGSGELSFSIGAIDTLDQAGGLSGGVDAAYAGDPVLAGSLSVTTLQFMGTEPDGRFKFGGGDITLSDPAGEFTFDGIFGEYLIDDTTIAGSVLSSFGLLDFLSITDTGDTTIEEDGTEVAGKNSIFLRDFVATTMGADLTDAEWLSMVGIDFSFVTDTDLATLTNSFTTSALSVPATFVITGNGVPEPSIALLVATGLVALGARRSWFAHPQR